MKFDMSLIEIDSGQLLLPFFIPVHRKAIESTQNIKIIGLMQADNGTLHLLPKLRKSF